MNKSGKEMARGAYHWSGMDVAKATFDASLVRCGQHFPDTELRDVPVHSFSRSPEGVDAFLAWLDAQGVAGEQVRVVMEATGKYSTELAVWLLSKRAELAPAIVNPRRTSAFMKSMGMRNKTDSLEARALGFYAVERHPVAYQALSAERAELRELSRFRDRLVRQRTAMKNEKSEGSSSRYVCAKREERLKRISAEIAEAEIEMRNLVKQHENLTHDIALLTSIYGVAFVSASTIIAELGDLRRFSLARQLTAFAGMSPRLRESGTSIHGRSRLCKQGNPRIRQILYLCALTAIRGNNQFRKTYRRLLVKGKSKMVALIAIMRKLLILMRAILINGIPYNPMGISK